MGEKLIEEMELKQKSLTCIQPNCISCQSPSRDTKFCFYFNAFFCCKCFHSSHVTLPSKITRDWDFREFGVSQVAFNILSRTCHEPVHRVSDELYSRVRILRLARDYRSVLTKIHAYVSQCRHAKLLLFHKLRAHLYLYVDLYSHHDLLHMESLVSRMRLALVEAIRHVQQCVVCRARGFHCEGCRGDDLLFPFDLQKVTQCNTCHACFHRACRSSSCPKCARIKRRRETFVSMEMKPK